MKRTIIITTLIIAMCLTMAFPASAANQIYDKKDYINVIEKFKTDLANGTALYSNHSLYLKDNPNWRNTYKYVMFCGTLAGSIVLTDRNVSAYVSESPIIKIGDKVLKYNIKVTGYEVYSASPMTYLDVGLYDGEYPRLDTTNTNNIGHYFYEFSTAKLDGYDSDFVVSRGHYWYTKLYPYADPTALNTVISQAEQVKRDSYQLDTWNALQTAILNAKDFIASADFTKDDVVNETSKLQTVIDCLVKLPDSSELRSAIDYASRVVNTGYEEQVWKDFENSLSAAHSLLNGMMYTEQELKTHLIELRKSMNTLISLPYTTDNLNMLPNSFMLTIPIILTTAIALYALVRWLNIIPWLMRLFIH